MKKPPVANDKKKKELSTSEIRYRRLFESAKDGNLILDAETGKIVDVNPFLIDLLGYSKKELTEKSIWEIRTFQDVIENKEKFFELQQKKYVRYDDLPLVTSDGREILVDFVSNVYQVNNKKLIQYNIRDITEFTRTRNEIKFQANLINNVGQAVIATDLQGKVIYWNQAAEKIYGWSVAEAIGGSISDLSSAQQADEQVAEILQKISTGKTWAGDYFAKRKDGSSFPAVLNCSPILDSNGKVTGTLGITSDVTERKLAEEKVINERNKATQYFETAGIMLVALDKAGKVTRINKKGCEVLQYSEPEIIGKEWFAFLPENNVQAIRATFKQLMEEEIEDLEFYENTIVNRKGEERLIEWNNTILRDTDGKPVGTLSSGEDITQRKLREKITLAQRDLGLLLNTVSNSLECYRAGFKTLSEISGMDCGMIYLFDKDYKSINAIYSEGFSDKFVEAASHYDAGSPNVKWLKAGNPGFLQHKEFPAKTPEYIKEENIKSMAIIPMYYEDKVFGSINLASKKEINISSNLKNEVESIVSAIANTIVRIQTEDEIRDLNASLETKVKERTKQLNQAKKEADSANKLKSTFLANMSHEIRTPMNAILGYADILNNTITDNTHKEYVNSIRLGGSTLMVLINDILDLSKIEANKMELQFDYVHSKAFFNEFEKIFSIKLQQKGVDFITDISSATPEGIYIDELRLRQILLNLLSNAIKFTDEGEVKLKVHCENLQTSEYSDGHSEDFYELIIEVSDTGAGIPEELQKKIFEPFTQDNNASSNEGTGLGLAIVHRMVTLMNGTIMLTSSLGKGSTFKIRIPDVAFMREFEVQSAERLADPGTIEFNEATVLIVDDEEHSRKYLVDALANTRIRTIEASDAIEALKITKRDHPDLIITDVRMEKMDGFTLLAKIRKLKSSKQIPVIAYSASVMKEQKLEIHKRDFACLLIKPVSLAELFHELCKFLPYSIKVSHESVQDAVNEDSVNKPVERLPELLSILETTCSEEYKKFSKRQPIGEILVFGKRLEELGKKHHVPVLSAFGSNLIDAAEGFNVEKILDLIKQYPGLIEEIKKPMEK